MHRKKVLKHCDIAVVLEKIWKILSQNQNPLKLNCRENPSEFPSLKECLRGSKKPPENHTMYMDVNRGFLAITFVLSLACFQTREWFSQPWRQPLLGTEPSNIWQPKTHPQMSLVVVVGLLLTSLSSTSAPSPWKWHAGSQSYKPKRYENQYIF